MSYADPAEVRAVLARDSSVVSGTGAELEDAQLAQHISSAAAQVDAMCNLRYSVPFDPTPDVIKHLTIDIAAYLADLTFRQHKDYSSELDPVYLRYQRAMNLLTALNTGAALIDIEDSSTEVFDPHVVNPTPKMIEMSDLGLGESQWWGDFRDPDWYRH